MNDQRKKYWQEVLQKQSLSGLSKKAFCEQQGINAPTFYYWQRRLAEREQASEGGFHRIKPRMSNEIVVCLPNKEIKLRSDCADTLAQVIQHLCSA